jgi:hypothetical protein
MNTPAAASPIFKSPFDTGNGNTSEPLVQSRFMTGCPNGFGNLHVDVYTVGGAAVAYNTGVNADFAIRVGGANALSCTIFAGSSFCTNNGTSSAVASDSLVTFGMVSSVASTTAGNVIRFGVSCK